MKIVKFTQKVKRKGVKLVEFCFALENKEGELSERHCYTQRNNRNRGLRRWIARNPKYSKSKIVSQ